MIKYEIEAETIEVAREQVKAKIPENHKIISEQVICDGIALTIERTVEADNLEDATKQINHMKPKGFHVVSENVIQSERIVRTITSNKEYAASDLIKTQSDLPKNIAIIEEKVLSLPERTKIKIRSFDEKDAYSFAKSQVDEKYGSTAIIEDYKLLSSGRKGFLGIGRKPDMFLFQIIVKPAVIEITYETKNKYIFKLKETTKPKARIIFEVGDPEVIARRKEAIRETCSEATRETCPEGMSCYICNMQISEGKVYGHDNEPGNLLLDGYYFCRVCIGRQINKPVVGHSYILSYRKQRYRVKICK